MARGNNKTSSLKVTTREEVSAFAEPSPGEKAILSGINSNPADAQSLFRFLRKLADYTEGTGTGERLLSKQNKDAAVKAFKELPDYIKREFAWSPMAPLEDGSVGQIPLYRGAAKATSEFNGDTVVPFSTQQRVAKKFSGYSNDDSKQKFYSLKDVESYAGGIDVRKISRALQRLGRWDGKGPLSPASGNPVYISGSEHEVLLYGVKWKPGVE